MVDKNAYLKEMGIDVWLPRNKQQEPAQTAQNTENTVQTDLLLREEATSGRDFSHLDWEPLKKCVAECTACPLHKTRTQTVFGVGTQQAKLLIIGEAPGANEDLQGEPFVGRAGKLLDSMLLAIGLERQQIFIANILKCRPPNNRDPNPEEVATCTPFLNRQIALIQPTIMMAVGRIAAHYLLQTNIAMGKLRGILHNYGETKTPLIVTYHPAYLLRSPREKAKAYEDLLWLKQLM